jgi:hypothetical protein
MPSSSVALLTLAAPKTLFPLKRNRLYFGNNQFPLSSLPLRVRLNI